MTTNLLTNITPLWLSIEEQIQKLGPSDLDAGTKEETVQSLARALDTADYNVSRHGGNLMQLRRAVDARIEVGSSMLTDFNGAVEALTLDDVSDTLKATLKLVDGLGDTWPSLRELERRSDILAIVDRTKLDLFVNHAKTLDQDQGIRYLIEQSVAEASIIDKLEISEAKLGEVKDVIAAEKAEMARIDELLAAVEGASNEDKAKHLISNDVTEESIVAFAGLDPAAIEAAKLAMEAEMAEKKRLEEEAEAAKQAAAEGPSLDQIPADEMLEHIESIREIMEFSEEEAEIRAMCEQSNIPKSLVDIAVSDADKLDELEKQAEG